MITLFKASISLLIFLLVLLSPERKLLKCIILIVHLSISHFSPANFFFYFGIQWFYQTYLRSLCLITDRPFYPIKWSFKKSVLVFIVLKSTLHDINITILVFFCLVFTCYIFCYSFTFNLPVLLYLKCVSWKQSITGSCFYIVC